MGLSYGNFPSDKNTALGQVHKKNNSHAHSMTKLEKNKQY